MKKYISEFTGTMLLVICGCGGALAMNFLFSALGVYLPTAFSTLAIAFTFGLAYMVLWYTFSDISGCHLNPAVSLGVVMTGRMKFKDFVIYVISQFLGGIAGAAMLWAMFGSNKDTLFANGYYDKAGMETFAGRTFLVELVLSFILVLVFLAVTAKDKKNPATGIICGLSITLLYMTSIPFSNGSLNPARTLGPALLIRGAYLKHMWIFMTAPFLGAIIAVLFYLAVLEKKEKSEIKHKKNK
ncbi:MAG: aquaporin [Clostridiales bacterium]|nr:aquaporin [Clostridiales bacterium]